MNQNLIWYLLIICLVGFVIILIWYLRRKPAKGVTYEKRVAHVDPLQRWSGKKEKEEF